MGETQKVVAFAERKKIDMGGFQKIDRERLIEGLRGNVTVMVELIKEWDGECNVIDEDCASGVFYPQTYAAACFMLALGKVEQIAALPRGIRECDLFCKETTERIKYDADRFNTELMSLMKPQGAFVSSYSDPNVIRCLKEQDINTITLDDGNDVDEVMGSMKVVGKMIGQEKKAELMVLFMKAALNALDKRVEWLKMSKQMPRFLCAYQTDGLRMPTKKTITGKILERMGITCSNENAWSVPLSNEKIKKEEVELLVIATEEKKESTANYRYIPYHIQQSPTQFIILAYFDILEAISS